MPHTPPRLLILGAHPDDAEFHAGGLSAIYRARDYAVKWVSLTNGDAGHHTQSGPALARRRRAELAASASRIGAQSETWEHHDGRLEPTLELRWQVIREIRSFAPDLVLTHRTNDYHPDHRATAHVVRDASYLVTVPALVPDVPILSHDPVVGYLSDRFQRPAPLAGDVVIDITNQVDAIVDMLCCHESQFFEWLPFNRSVVNQVPSTADARRAWLAEWYRAYLLERTDRYRAELISHYGPERAAAIQYTEVFEISEYGSPLHEAARQRLFPQ